MAATGTAKTTVWRWQERFMEEGIEGLLRDKTRPPGRAPVADDRTKAIVEMTLRPPRHEATHWTARAAPAALQRTDATGLRRDQRALIVRSLRR